MEVETNYILNMKPTYLFVDSDIDRNRIGDICWSNDSFGAKLNRLGRGRALVLDNLTALFNGVRAYYEPIEHGQLITVYKLKV